LATKRPNAKDLSIAYDFGKKIKVKLDNLNDLNQLENIEVPGNFPYVVKNIAIPPITPQTNDTCVTCGLCGKHCPTAAINLFVLGVLRIGLKTIRSNKIPRTAKTTPAIRAHSQ